jgi:Plasmid recombination enzyme.
MPQYAIMRFAKHSGGAGALEAHHERTKEKYASNPDIDTSRSKNNFHIVQPTTSYKREADSRILSAGCRTRKDSVRFVDTLVTASPAFFKGKSREEVQAFFETSVCFLAQKIGKDNIFAATVHMDEKTPHMHLCFTPVTEDGRLSAKEIIGNRPQLTKWQDDFFTHMVAHFPDLERGESASKTGRRHIPMRVFKEAVSLSKQARKIDALLNDMNIFNANKRKEEIIEAFKRFFPRMEKLAPAIKKYKKEIDALASENADLEKALNAAKPSITKQLEASSQQQELLFLRQFYAAVPEEYKAVHLKAQQKQTLTHEKGDN